MSELSASQSKLATWHLVAATVTWYVFKISAQFVFSMLDAVDLQDQGESVPDNGTILQEEAEVKGTKKVEDEDGLDGTLQLSLSHKSP